MIKEGFQQPVISIKHDIRLGRLVIEKSLKIGQQIKNLTFPRPIAFCGRKLGVNAHSEEFNHSED